MCLFDCRALGDKLKVILFCLRNFSEMFLGVGVSSASAGGIKIIFKGFESKCIITVLHEMVKFKER